MNYPTSLALAFSLVAVGCGSDRTTKPGSDMGLVIGGDEDASVVGDAAMAPEDLTGADLTGADLSLFGNADLAGTGGPPLSNVSIATSINGSCVIEKTQHLPKCWGYNAQGQLGIGSTAQRGDGTLGMGDALPYVNLGALRTATAISMREQHACVILDTGAVKCWGYNSYGQLGVGTTDTLGDSLNEVGNFPVVDLGAGRTALAIGVGDRFSCAILDDHTVKCWGDATYGKIANATSHGSSGATMGAGLPAISLGTGRTATALAVGYEHACVILDDGNVKCWGHNNDGRLGLGDIADRGLGSTMGDTLLPVALGAHSAKAIAAGAHHTCAILEDGSMRCWGYNNVGQLGIEDRATRGTAAGEMGTALPAVKLGTSRTAKAIALGSYNTCALLDDHSVKCWGGDSYGALGLPGVTQVGGDFMSMGDKLAAIDLGAGTRVPAGLSVGDDGHVCVVFDDGAVKCWGYNAYGHLGLGDKTSRGVNAGELGMSLPFVKLTGP